MRPPGFCCLALGCSIFYPLRAPLGSILNSIWEVLGSILAPFGIDFGSFGDYFDDDDDDDDNDAD